MIRGAAEACLEIKAGREARAAAMEEEGVGQSEPSSAARPGTVASEASASSRRASPDDEAPTRARGGRGKGRAGRGTKRDHPENSERPKAKARR